MSRVTSIGSIHQQAPGLYRLLTLIHGHCDSFKEASQESSNLNRQERY